MKSYYKWLFAGLVGYAILITWTAVDKNEYAEAKRVEFLRLEAKYEFTLDSARRAGKSLTDSISAAKTAKLVSDSIALAEKGRAQKIQKAYEKITHVRYANDTLRSRAISELYHSFRRR